VLLRAGGVSAEALAEALGTPLRAAAATGVLTAPGQLPSHYAPRAPLRLDVTTPAPGEIWIGFGPGCDDAVLSLSVTGDLSEAAARLFEVLHSADALGQPIAVAPVPEEGLGVAINDRLRRAAAPR